MAVRRTISSTVADLRITWMGNWSPISIGPIDSASDRRFSKFMAIFPDWSSGKIRTFAPPFNLLNGNISSMISGITAASPCISPSMIRSGFFCTAISTACRTLRVTGWSILPKFENESMAILGSISNSLTILALCIAISASSSAVGSIFPCVSARK